MAETVNEWREIAVRQAAEIAALQSTIRALSKGDTVPISEKDSGMNCSCDFKTGECQAPQGCKAVAEMLRGRERIKQLTAALQEIADILPLLSINVGKPPTIYDAEQKIARKALGLEQC